MRFDRIAIFDWPAASRPKRGKDSIWLGLAGPEGVTAENLPTRAEAEARMKIAADALDGFSIRGHKHSYQIWLELPEPWRADVLRDQAMRKGVFFLTGDAFVVGRQQAPHAIRICVGSCRTRDEVRQGVETIRDILHGPAAATPVIA